MTTMTKGTSGAWDVSSRTIVYAAIGAALYGVTAVFQIALPGTANVSLRPSFALVTFFGVAFGPIVGLFVGLVGNAIADRVIDTAGAVVERPARGDQNRQRDERDQRERRRQDHEHDHGEFQEPAGLCHQRRNRTRASLHRRRRHLAGHLHPGRQQWRR
jgi:hypothetical protein